jgi:hypothetical protein
MEMFLKRLTKQFGYCILVFTLACVVVNTLNAFANAQVRSFCFKRVNDQIKCMTSNTTPANSEDDQKKEDEKSISERVEEIQPRKTLSHFNDVTEYYLFNKFSNNYNTIRNFYISNLPEYPDGYSSYLLQRQLR